jgi:hypothetical protein
VDFKRDVGFFGGRDQEELEKYFLLGSGIRIFSAEYGEGNATWRAGRIAYVKFLAQRALRKFKEKYIPNTRSI